MKHVTRAHTPLQRDSASETSPLVALARLYTLKSGSLFLPSSADELRAPFTLDILCQAADELVADGLARLEPRDCGGLEVIVGMGDVPVSSPAHAPASVVAAMLAGAP